MTSVSDLGTARTSLGMGAAWRNRGLRCLLVGYAGAAVSEWAVWLAALVDAEQRSGSAAAGWVALGLLVPGVVAAQFAGRAFGGPRPARVLVAVYVAQAVSLAVAAVVAAIDGPLVAGAGAGALATRGVAFVRPGQAVMAPSVVRTARELTTSNLMVGYADSGCVLVAPLIATAVLALGGPSAVMALCAGLAVIGWVAAVPLRTAEREAPDDTDEPDRDAAAPSVHAPVREVLDELHGQRHVGALLGVLSLQHVVMGTIGLMFVVLAADELDLGSSGAGLLNIGFGVGAVLSGVGATVLVGRGRLAPVAVACVLLMAAAALLVGSITTLSVAMVGLAVMGFARSLLDVSVRMLLQRTVSPTHLAATFAIVEMITAVGLFVGTLYSQIVTTTVGAPVGLLVLAASLVLALAVLGPRIWAADRSADVPVVAIALLRSMPVFSPLPPSSLEAVARGATERTFAPGEVVIREGDPGDSYHAIAGGRVDVDLGGRFVRSLSRGDGVGEVALLHRSPRTASVVAVEPAPTPQIDRGASLHAARRRTERLDCGPGGPPAT